MEALSVVGGALLSTSCQWLLTKLESTQLLNFAKHEQVRLELRNWRSLLLKINAVLEDAEAKQTADPLVKIWLDEVRDLAFDMEDILDEFRYESPSVSVPGARTSEAISDVIYKCFTGVKRGSCFNSNHGISGKVKDISDRLQGISTEINALGLNLSKMDGKRSNKLLIQRLPTTSMVEPAHDVCGREKEKEEILQYLLKGEKGPNGVCVIPIVGMGGIGKTTLAQLIYNDGRVEDQFPLKAWVYVSEQLDLLAVTRKILEKVTMKSYDECIDLDSLQVRLREELSGKKFLFVLDDVWTESYLQWDLLRKPFTAGAQGSKIIITTRHCNVAKMMGNVPAYHIQVLPYDECLSLFAQHAFGSKNFRNAHPNVKEIGEKIVQRCKGLPLAVKTIGGLLRGKRSCDEWIDILYSKLWDLPEQGNEILPALRLSYHHLPSHLKRCFAYCAIYPKGYEFDKEELVSLWMAEGLVIQQPQGMKQMEDLGHKYFLDLLSRSFFHQASSKESKFMMHDLVSDLSQFVAGETCHTLTDHKFKHDHKSHANLEKVRYLSFMKKDYDTCHRFEVSYKMMSLRAFLSFSPLSHSFCGFLSNNVLHNFIPKLRYLRALSLCDYEFKILPQSIGELKHLRYLNLSGCVIKCLPESVTSLLYLQTLKLQRCNKLTNLPAKIGCLKDIRHLDITQTKSLKVIPSGIGMLKNLLTLPKFIVGEDADGLRIRELKDLSHLRGQLSIQQVHNVLDVEDAKHANLNEKEGLDELMLKWTSDFQNSRNESNEMHVLGWLKPHQNLKKLIIKYYGAKGFPSWIGDPFFSNVTHIELCHCQRITSLPSLGQLFSLEKLIIKGFISLKTVGFEFYGYSSSSVNAFPSLKILRFEDMLLWEEWSFSVGQKAQAIQQFPLLRELYIFNCPKFVAKLPTSLPSLVKLEICRCPHLTYSSVSLPSLRILNLEVCNEMFFRGMVHLTCLRSLKITNISHLSCLPNGFKQDMIALRDMKIEKCDELISLWEDGSNTDKLLCLKCIVIKNCPLFGFQHMGRGDLITLSHNLEVLELLDCNNLKRLPNISCLRVLSIKGCKALRSLNGIMKMDFGSNNICLEKLKIRFCPSLRSFPRGKLPPTLRTLVIEGCELLHSLPEGIMSKGDEDDDVVHLQELIIRNCPSLKSFPRGKFPTSLKTLFIEDCEGLQSLQGEGMMNEDDKALHLENLRLQGLSSMMIFPSGQLPKTLKSLIIFTCRGLESFPNKMLQHTKALETIEICHCSNLKTLPFDCFSNLTHLHTLVISGCTSLESFSDASGQLFTPNLKLLRINRCKNLKSLPNKMHMLKSLKDLKVKNCPSIFSIPEGGFPPNLSHLFIDCENLKQPMFEWGLQMLTSLGSLWIHNCRCNLENVFFPTSLIELYIRNVADLKSLPGGLLKNLSTLKVLDISRCHQLQALPREGLPHSLGSLRIDECPLLQHWCLENKDSRRLIAHIPCLCIGSI